MARGHRPPALALLFWLASPLAAAPPLADERLTFTPEPTSTQVAATASFGSRYIVAYLEKVNGVERCLYQIADFEAGTLGAAQIVPLLPGYTAQDRPTVTREDEGTFVVSCQNTRADAQATALVVIPAGQSVGLPPTVIVATDTAPPPDNAGGFYQGILAIDSSKQSPFHGNAYFFSTLRFTNFPDSGGIRMHRRLPGGAWPLTSTAISDTPNFNESPSPFVGNDGRVHVAWYDQFVRDKIWYSASADGGATWSPQSLVGFASRHPDYVDGSTASVCPSVSVEELLLLYGDGTGPTYQVKRSLSSDGGKTWGAPTVIAPAGGDQFLPAVLCDEAGGRAYVAYYQAVGEGNLADVHMVSTTDGGTTWSPPTRLNDVSIDHKAVGALRAGTYSKTLTFTLSTTTPFRARSAVVPGTNVFPIWTALANPGNTDLYTAGTPAGAVPLVAAVLPASRSVQVGTPATLFVTVINAGTVTANQIEIRFLGSAPATFSYQTTDANNLPTGAPNTPVDIPPGQGRTFLVVLTPTAPFPASDILLGFAGTNTAGVRTIVGVNTYLQSASAAPVADLIMLTATPTGGGIVDVPVGGLGAFAMATVNVGAGDTLTISADTGAAALPVSVLVCRTIGGACVAPPALSVTETIGTNETPTYSFFASATAAVAFDPANNRLIISAREAGGALRGRTSLAVRAQ